MSRPRGDTLEAFLIDLRQSLVQGWNGFTASLTEPKAQRVPAHIPSEYAMYVAKVKITYQGSEFATVKLELTLDEIDSIAEHETLLSTHIAELFTNVGLPSPNPVPVISVEHQIAQQLHACTSANHMGVHDRANDLIDIYLLCKYEQIDLMKLAQIAPLSGPHSLVHLL